STNRTDNQFIQLSVTDDPNETGSNFSVQENTDLVTDLPKFDSSGGRITYTLNGPDASRFRVGGAAKLRFKQAPDFEDPTDADGNNVYAFNIVARDSAGNTTTQATTVTVTNEVSVYLFGGQSNMAGVGSDENDLTGALANPLPDVQIWQDGVNRFVDLRSGFDKNFGTGSGFGAELGFGFALEEARDDGDSDTEEIYIAKYALGSTDLAVDWAVNGQNNVYDAFKDWVDSALGNLTNQGIGYTVEGMMWMQGENDASDVNQAANYQTNLTGFISDIRTRYGQGVDFVIGRLHEELPPGFYTEDDVVRGAQVAVANSDSRNFLVDTDDFPITSDRVHFTSEGHLSLGEEFAEVFIDD
ncbi:MAG: sialate O-acetylesterase, partial [Cyanobacteria bacterium J06649_4]